MLIGCSSEDCSRNRYEVGLLSSSRSSDNATNKHFMGYLFMTINGDLIATTPVARECHGSSYDKAKCDAIQKDYFKVNWRMEQPGAVQHVNWETFHGQGCLGFNQTQPCLQGAVPVYTVNVSSIADVQATVRFAAKHNIRLVVKNTGHDFLGRSIGASSINLWTYFMKKIQVTDNFVPERAPQGTAGIHAIILESGVLWRDVYKIIDQHDRVVVGGDEPTVGAAGGYCLGGGHSHISRHYGLCVDNVLQYKVVTADGKLRVANAFQNTDLFWALRGGGPGFGVVVEVAYRTHPAIRNIQFIAATITSNDTEKIPLVTRDFFGRQQEWLRAGWEGVGYFDRTKVVIRSMIPNATVEQAQASVQPFLDFARSIPGVAVTEDKVTTFQSFYEYATGKQPPVSGDDQRVGHSLLLGGRLIPRTLFETERGVDRLVSALRMVQDDLKEIMPPGIFVAQLNGGGRVAQGNARDTSVVPAWRESMVNIFLPVGWTADAPSDAHQLAQQKLTSAIDRLRAITPTSGAYQNEADANEPDWQRSFFGANYRRLREIKRKYDPHGLLVCRRCVGSEDWNSDMVCPVRRRGE
ncbi:hypothetical protein BGW42_001080 [Actinomortierella wolfii]|nr:hypothetical protein BGW42_001080 [Actinomortierella wolfii]